MWRQAGGGRESRWYVCDYDCARGGMARTVCMYGWHYYCFVVTGATGQLAGQGRPMIAGRSKR